MYNFGYQSSSSSGLPSQKAYFTSPVGRLPPPRNYNKNNNSNQTEQARRWAEDVEMYPIGFAELLKNEEKNIKNFKSRVSKEKERINQDISSFKIQFNHNIEDLRLSIHAELDRIYQNYLERYAQFKGELLEINRLKEEMEIEVAASKVMPRKNPPEGEKKLSSSNAQVISNMERGNQDLKKTHMMNHISELQKERIQPLKDYLRQIIVLTEYENGFYQTSAFQKVLDRLKQQLNVHLRNIYQNKNQFIRDANYLTFKDGPKILDGVLEESKAQDKDANKPGSQIISAKKTNLTPRTGIISPCQQTAKFEWLQQLKLRDESQIKCFDQILCGTAINNKLVFGHKNGRISLFGRDGSQLGVLKEHKASICTLGQMKIKGKVYLVSGSDHGCSSVIVWDVEREKIFCKLSEHSAAVTALVDLQDDTHLLSGSYDKKLNIYNMQNQTLVYSLPNNKTSITGAILNSSNNKLITCGLDKALSVWEVHRGGNGKVETISLMRKVQSGCLVCSMVASQLHEDAIVMGDKEGRVKIINVSNGQVLKTINCSSNYLIQLILIERSSKPNHPIILAWPYKQQRILIVNSENETIDSKTTKNYLEYGCGISPKCFLLDGGHALWTVSHSQAHPDPVSYRIDDSL